MQALNQIKYYRQSLSDEIILKARFSRMVFIVGLKMKEMTKILTMILSRFALLRVNVISPIQHQIHYRQL